MPINLKRQEVPDMAIYKIKKTGIFLIAAICFFVFISSVLFLISENHLDLPIYSFVFLAVGSISLAVVVLGSLNMKIVTTEIDIKKTFRKDDHVDSWLSHLYLDQTCRWELVHHVKTSRSKTSGTYSTKLYWDKEQQDRDNGSNNGKLRNHGVISINAQYTDYIKLLKEVRERAVNAEIDATTEDLIEKGMG